MSMKNCHSWYSRNRVDCILEVNTAAQRPWGVIWSWWQAGLEEACRGCFEVSFGAVFGSPWSLYTNWMGLCCVSAFLSQRGGKMLLFGSKLSKQNPIHITFQNLFTVTPLLPFAPSTSKCHNYWRLKFWEQQVLAYGWKQSTGERCGRHGTCINPYPLFPFPGQLEIILKVLAAV